MEYKFYIEGAQMYPLYGDDMEKTYTKQENEKFFRETIGELIFKGDDYTTLKGYADDREINIVIKSSCDNYYADWWTGYFGKYDCVWDEDNCECRVTPTPDDDYICLMQHWEEEYNILNVSQQYDVKVDFAQLEYFTMTGDVTLQTTDAGSNRYGYSLSGTNYTFYASASPVNKPYGGDITSDVYCLDNSNAAIGGCNAVLNDYSAAYGKNINNLSGLPDLGAPGGSKDRGFIVYKTEITQDKGLTGGANSERTFTITTTWFREVIWTIDIDGNATQPSGGATNGWGGSSDHVDSLIVDGVKMHKWARIPDNITYSNLQWTTNNGSVLPINFTFKTSLLTDHTETLSAARPLSSVIDYFMTQMNCSLTYQSTFFDNDSLPSDAPTEIKTIITAHPTYNYVTEETNKLNHLMIAQKSDIVSCVQSPGTGCSASEAATKGLITFKDLYQYLNKMFNVYLVIENSHLRLEHERYFQRSLGSIDLTSEENTFANKNWEWHINKYRYVRNEMYGRERWTFMEQHNVDFIGEPIEYDEILSNTRIEQRTKEYNLDLITTDIQYIYDVESASASLDGSIDRHGFVILQCSYDASSTPKYECENETGVLSGVQFPNNHLSVANLQDAYWRWGRILEDGTMNNDSVTFESWFKAKEQDEIRFDLCCTSFDPTDLIKTSMGNGEVVSAGYNFSSGILRVILRYET